MRHSRLERATAAALAMLIAIGMGFAALQWLDLDSAWGYVVYVVVGVATYLIVTTAFDAWLRERRQRIRTG